MDKTWDNIINELETYDLMATDEVGKLLISNMVSFIGILREQLTVIPKVQIYEELDAPYSVMEVSLEFYPMDRYFEFGFDKHPYGDDNRTNPNLISGYGFCRPNKEDTEWYLDDSIPNEDMAIEIADFIKGESND